MTRARHSVTCVVYCGHFISVSLLHWSTSLCPTVNERYCSFIGLCVSLCYVWCFRK